MDAKTNGSLGANPHPELFIAGGTIAQANAGLTKREQIAKDMLAGLLANPGGPVQASPMSGWQSTTNCTRESVAAEAVAYADALLAELAKEPK